MKDTIFGIVELYYGKSGKKGFYNSQELGIARAMKQKGYISVIFYPDTTISTIKEESIEPYITVVYCPAKALGVHSYYNWTVLLKYSINVVQIGSDNQLFVPSLIKFCKKNNIRFYNYIGTIESNTFGTFKKIFSYILSRRNIKIYKNSKCFVKTNTVYSQLCQKGVHNLDFMPVGLDISIIPEIPKSKLQIKKELGIAEDKNIVMFVGRIDEYKRPLEIIKLMKALPDKFFFIIIGSGNMNKNLQTELSEFSNNNYVWIEQIPNTAIHTYYKASDYVVNFNQSEIFGMSILEAMYHGCTVIANHAPGPDIIIKDGQSGWLVDNTIQMVELLKKGKKLYPKTIQKRIYDNFIWEKNIETVQLWIENK